MGLLVLLAGVGRAADPPAAVAAPGDASPVERLTKLADGLYCSAQPEGPAGFEALARMGIRTILSVDGATPDVDAAEAAGLRYVHLPIGYDGMTDEQVAAVARAIRDLPGPVLVHCHHGKHRGPTAAVAAGVLLGRVPADGTRDRLLALGTDPRYEGLFRAAERAGGLPESLVDAAPATFPSVSPVAPLTERMVTIDVLFARLKGTPRPASAAEDALLLRQQWTELRRDDAPSPDGLAGPRHAAERAAWDQSLSLSELAGRRLEGALAARAGATTTDATDAAESAIRTALSALETQCAACHADFRH